MEAGRCPVGREARGQPCFFLQTRDDKQEMTGPTVTRLTRLHLLLQCTVYPRLADCACSLASDLPFHPCIPACRAFLFRFNEESQSEELRQGIHAKTPMSNAGNFQNSSSADMPRGRPCVSLSITQKQTRQLKHSANKVKLFRTNKVGSRPDGLPKLYSISPLAAEREAMPCPERTVVKRDRRWLSKSWKGLEGDSIHTMSVLFRCSHVVKLGELEQ